MCQRKLPDKYLKKDGLYSTIIKFEDSKKKQTNNNQLQPSYDDWRFHKTLIKNSHLTPVIPFFASFSGPDQ